MRAMWFTGAVIALAAGGAQAAELEIKHAAARVVVIPEARSDVQVTVQPGSSALPRLDVRRDGASVKIDGGLRNRINGCQGRGDGPVGTAINPGGDAGVTVKGVGRVRAADLPLITARVPLNADVGASGAVWGTIDRTQSLDLSSAGCGDWTVGNVAGDLSISLAGSGDVVTGTARKAEVSIAGSGDVRIGSVSGALEASIAGSGDVQVVSVSGPIDASIAGSGDIVVLGGRTGALDASIAGSGDIRVDGVVESLDASIVGSGDVRVASVIRGVEHSIIGSGDIVVAGRELPRRGRGR